MRAGHPAVMTLLLPFFVGCSLVPWAFRQVVKAFLQ